MRRFLFAVLALIVASVASAQPGPMANPTPAAYDSLFVAAVLLQPAPATVNPTTVTFTPSADHNVLSLDGVTPIVASYELRVSLEGSASVLASLNLGKPTPVANVITVTNAIWFAALTPKTRYVGRVAAIGPTGVGVSDPSAPFGNVGPPAATPAPVMK
jgi:hypothetical protein